MKKLFFALALFVSAPAVAQVAPQISLDQTPVSGCRRLAVRDPFNAATDKTVVLGCMGTGSISTPNAQITGGSIIGITDLAIADGGTGASTAGAARTNLGLGTAATQSTGTSGATIPLLNTANTWAANQSFLATIAVVTDFAQNRLVTASGRGWRMGNDSTGTTLGNFYIQSTNDNFASSFPATVYVSPIGELYSTTGTATLGRSANRWPTGYFTALDSISASITNLSLSASTNLSAAAGSGIFQFYRTGSSTRWAIGRNGASESGSNVGSDFVVDRHDDAGTYIATPLRITRSTGLTTISSLSTPAALFTGSAVLDRTGQSVDADFYVRASGGYAASLYFTSSALNRWQFGRTSATESGANAGSNFAINRSNDAGSYLGTAMQIFRATGDAVFERNVTLSPSASNVPATNGQMTFEATSNTVLTIRLKGSDGVVRSAALTLAP